MTNPFNQKLFLVGMMGSGKTEVGLQFSRKYNLSFFDTDQEIEKMAGCSITEIFANQGESEFRKMEQAVIDSILTKESCIISCGGGLCIPEGMMERLKILGIVACLWAEPRTILARINKDNSRPLIDQGDPLSSIEEILQKRRNRYLAADKILNTENKSIQEIIQEISKFFPLNTV
ncbi:MAG: shikimate kinase [Opitutae bacterium]|nr:shikimate kinase [Opitutae bacterium]